MKLYKNLMVVFRGHVRTWNYVSKPTLEFYESLADNVDYYLCTWYKDVNNFTMVQNSFNGKNLIKFLIVMPTHDLSNGWIGPGYQGYRLLPYKRLRERELGSKYDAVIDTRFDIIASQEYEKMHSGLGVIVKNKPITKIEPNTLYTDKINYNFEQEPNVKIPRLNDHWFIMSSDMYQPFTERFIRKEKYSSHEEFYFLAQDEGWKIDEAVWAKTMIVRPNVISHIKDPYHYIEYEKAPIVPKGLYEYNHDWSSMSVQDRIQSCKNNGIDPSDYEFQLSLVSGGAVN